MNQKARDLGVTVIGPATVGAIAPGAFKIANIGGTIENIHLTLNFTVQVHVDL